MVGLGRLSGRWGLAPGWGCCRRPQGSSGGALAGRLGTMGGLVGRTVSEGVTFTVTQHVIISS